MLKRSQLESIFSFVAAYYENPRISVRELHRKYSHYAYRNSTLKLLRFARREKVIMGPRIWCNSGLDVEVHMNEDDPLLLLEKSVERPEVTYMTALIGQFSRIVFKVGASTLQYAESILPVYPAKKTVDEIRLEKRGKLPEDSYPHNWDQLDWDVYRLMKDPSVSFSRVGDILGVSWHTAKDHYERIIKDCKPWIAVLPRGYDNYQQAYLMFQTDYEVGLREELQKLDRSSFLYKFNGTILLHLFHDGPLQNLRALQCFFDLKRKGVVHDLHVSIPIGCYSLHW